jgi:DNA polymerase-3 subunit gamma/tau
MLSTSAFNALLKTLEEPPAHALFILATTEIHKIPQTIISRCQRFDFRRIATPELVSRLKMIAEKEGVEVEEDVLFSVARLSEGCLRDAESLFGQILALGDKKITKDQASIILPVTNTEAVVELIDAVTRRDLKAVIERLNIFVDQGGSMKNFTDELIDFSRTLLIARIGGTIADQYDATTIGMIDEMKARLNERELASLLDALLRAKVMTAPDALAQLPLEIVLTEFCAISVPPPYQGGAGGGLTPSENQSPNPISDVESDESTIVPANKATVPERSIPEPVYKVSPVPKNGEAPTASQSQSLAPGELSAPSFSVADLTKKWIRCVESVKKRSIALPLVLHDAEPSAIHKEFVEIGFRHRFHFETMLVDKNIELLSAAINEVMQSAIRVRPVFLAKEDEEVLGQLADAFGGEIVS